MLPLKIMPLLIRCSNFCILPNGKRKQHLCFLTSTCFLLSFLLKSSVLLCRLLTKQFLVPLETITLQENTTLLSERASGSYLPLVDSSFQTRLLTLAQICCWDLTHPAPAMWSGHVAVHACTVCSNHWLLKTLQNTPAHSNCKHQIKSHNHDSSNQQVMEQHLIFSQLNYSQLHL